MLTLQQRYFPCNRHGYASRFPAQELPSTGRTSRGSAALTLRDADRMADMDILKRQLAGDAGDWLLLLLGCDRSCI